MSAISKTKKFKFSDLQSSKVNHGVNLGVFLENLIQAFLVGDIDIIELGLRPADELDTVEDLLTRVIQVVHDDNIVPSVYKLQRGEGTDISSSSGTRSHEMISLRRDKFREAEFIHAHLPRDQYSSGHVGRGRGRGRG